MHIVKPSYCKKEHLEYISGLLKNKDFKTPALDLKEAFGLTKLQSEFIFSYWKDIFQTDYETWLEDESLYDENGNLLKDV